MNRDFVGALVTDHARELVKTGDDIAVRLGETDYLRAGAFDLSAEIRRMADGRTFIGVEVTAAGPESGDLAVLLRWENIGDPARWVLPGPRGSAGERWPDVTPRPGIDPDSVEGHRRWVAWEVGNQHNARRGAGSGPWDASDWAAAAAEYWRLRTEALDGERGERDVIPACPQCGGQREPNGSGGYLCFFCGRETTI